MENQHRKIAGYRELSQTEIDLMNRIKAKGAELLELQAELVDLLNALDLEIDRLTERKRLISNRQKQIKDYLRENMEATGITKISCPLFTITCAQGRESVIVDNEEGIPDELMSVKTEIKPDKNAIAARLKAGEQVPGCRLERGQSSIRIK